jgi:hypothetical protein
MFTAVRTTKGARGTVVVKALCYKPESTGSSPDGVIEYFQVA